MSREARLVAVLLVMSAAGVSGLGFIAHQYSTALASCAVPGSVGVEQASARAFRLVDGFLAARSAAKAVASRYPGEIERLAAVVSGQPGDPSSTRMSANADAATAYRIARSNALSAHGMSDSDYASVRAAWRRFGAGSPVSYAALLSAFRARRQALQDVALGPLEVADDAIK